MTTSQKIRLAHKTATARREAWHNGDDTPLIVAAESRLDAMIYFSVAPAVFPNFRKRVLYTPPGHLLDKILKPEPSDFQAAYDARPWKFKEIDIEAFALRFGGALTICRA